MQESAQTLNVGLIGYGMIGKVHAFGYATLPFYAPDLPVVGKVVAVATSRPESAANAQRALQCEIATTDYREIIDNPKIDVVHICAPNADHLPAALAAIEAGKHVYCEKPIVVDAQEAQILEDAISKPGVPERVRRVAFHLRGFVALRRAKEIIAEGRLGRIRQYRLGYYHSSSLDPSAPFRWKHDKSGGVILDLGSHIVDLLDFLVGLPNELVAQTTKAFPTRPLKTADSTVVQKPTLVEDYVSILTRGTLGANDDPCDVVGVLEATKLANGAEDELSVEISGERGAIRFSLMDSHYLDFFSLDAKPVGWLRIPCGGRYDYPESQFPSPKSTTGWTRAHVASLASFYAAIAQQTRAVGTERDAQYRDYGADFAQALRVQRALEIVKRSALERRWERVTL